MRKTVGLLLMMSCFTEVKAFQATGGAPTAKPAVRACTLLTKEVVTQVTPYDKKALDLVMLVPPMEDSLGASGSACSYGGITMQVDPFAPAVFERAKKPTWAVVQGLGDTAYFADNGGRWAELYVAAEGRVLTIQMDIPMGKTAASIQPNVIALTKAILPKLK
jgi:hypothetical protein